MRLFRTYTREALGVVYDPATILASLAAAGSAVSALGSYQQGQAQKATDSYNAQVATQKSIQDQMDAQATADQIAIQNKRDIAQQASAYAAGGVDLTGSPLAVMMDTASQGELKRRLTLWQGSTESTADTQQAALDQASGAAAASAGLDKAGSTLLTGTTTALGPSGLNIAGAPLK